LALMYGAVEPVASQVEGAVLLSPPLHRATDAHLAAWAESGKPLTVLVPEHDDYLRPEAAAERFRLVPQARVVGVDGAKHLWVGEKYAARVLNEIVDEVTEQGSGPAGLPQEWDGPVATAAA
jgi:pimeloyl-ACP methyl ester carboxylesterase